MSCAYSCIIFLDVYWMGMGRSLPPSLLVHITSLQHFFVSVSVRVIGALVTLGLLVPALATFGKTRCLEGLPLTSMCAKDWHACTWVLHHV